MVHIDECFFGACCQAEHINSMYSGFCVGCVLTANEPLQGSDEIELVSAWLLCQSDIVVFT